MNLIELQPAPVSVSVEGLETMILDRLVEGKIDDVTAMAIAESFVMAAKNIRDEVKARNAPTRS